jgi:hypothetical protein
LTGITGNAIILHGRDEGMRIKRKPKMRELTEAEIIRGINSQLDGDIRDLVWEAYDEESKEEAINVCRKLCNHSGSASGGFWVMGKDDGLHIAIYKYAKYTEIPLAKQLIPYKNVVEHVIEERGKKSCQKPSKRNLKLKSRKSKKASD